MKLDRSSAILKECISGPTVNIGVKNPTKIEHSRRQVLKTLKHESMTSWFFLHSSNTADSLVVLGQANKYGFIGDTSVRSQVKQLCNIHSKIV